jgi:hypothetical protein
MKRCHQRTRPWAPQSAPRVLVSACIIACFAAFGSQALRAQPSPIHSVPPRNRYLLIVETSRSMQSRVQGVVQAAQDLLGSGFKELRPGDTLGLWTFNEALYAGKFPLQDFSPQTQQAVAARVAAYLQTQKYEKQASLEKILPQVQRLVANSEFLTVILVTTGNEDVRGTPFDAAINGSYKQWRGEQQTARMPLLTMLRSYRGNISGYTVNQAPWPVELPPLAPELQRPALAKKQSPAVAQSTAQAALESVRKTEPALSAPLTLAPSTAAPVTSVPANPSPQAVAPEPVQVAKAPATQPTLPIHRATAASTETNPAATLPVPVQAPPPKLAPSQTPANSLPRPFRQIVSTNLDKNQPAGPAQVPVKSPPAATAAVRPPATTTNRAPEARVATQPQLTATPKAQVAASSWRDLLTPKNLWIAGGCCAVLLLLLVVLVLRSRSRKPFHISLITQSVDKK